MSDHVFGIVELAFVFAVVVGFGAWQLHSVRRRDPSPRDDDRDEPGR